jgi:DNA-binding NarL/FixJ family response regulator
MTDMSTARPVIEIETTGPEASRRLLQLVSHGARNADRAVASRDAAIREAHRAGASLRDIAEVAGVSHMTVKRIVERERGD